MFTHMHVEWLVIPVAIMLAIGIIAQLSTWVVGPAKGLLPAAMTGDLPPIFRKTNKYGMPLGVLVVQGIISSAFAIAMIAIPSINEGYWILTEITSLINAVMYMFMFAAFIKLRKTKPDVKRPYKLPGGKIGMWLVGGVALITLFFAFAVGLLPETNGASFGMTQTILYVIGMLIAVLVIILLPPVILRKLKKPSWKPSDEEYKAWLAEDPECSSFF